MSATYTILNYHIVFGTKYRQPLIKGFGSELCRYITAIIKNQGGQLLQIGGIPDHIHIAVRLRPRHCLADVIKDIKGDSSRWINVNRKTPRRFAWQGGYGAFSVSQSQIGRVCNYIARQAAHHRRKAFKEEYLALLQKHGIEYDERFVWD